MIKKISIIWNQGKQEGEIKVKNGRHVKISLDDTVINDNTFNFIADGKKRLNVIVESEEKQASHGAVVNVFTKQNPFSFFAEHINEKFPVYIPEYNVIVTDFSDKRNYEEIEDTIKKTNGMNKLQQMEFSPEETYQDAANNTRKLRGHTWLGLSRDIRIFDIVFPDPDRTTMQIFPKYHGFPVVLPEIEKLDEKMRMRYGDQIFYDLNFSRGCACSQELKRYLEDGYLPILCGILDDEDIRYRFTMFTTLEKTQLSLENLRGTHFLVADGYGGGHMFTEEQKEMFDSLAEKETNREEETVFFLKIEAVNTKKSPAYAFFKTLSPGIPLQYSFKDGMSFFSKDRVFGISMLNGKPIQQEEFTVFLLPGEKAEFEVRIPHKPVSEKRAEQLMKESFETRRKECRKFWKSKLQNCAEINIPEKRIENMIKAGFLHLDLIAYGLEPDNPVAACIGVYCPIGSESSPIIQFFDTFSQHKLAERSLQYFVEKQHEDGFMQNFGGYMLETGAALWTMGEHFRYTNDTGWVKKIKPSLLKAVEYILKWIERNKKDDLIGKGYGMIDGKVADPEDPYHAFMLNGYAYLGLQRVSEMLEAIKDVAAKEIRKKAEELKENIRKSFFASMARSPVVPLGDGTWVPTASPWPEDNGLCIQYINDGRWFTHGTFLGRDSMLGPLYLIFQEVLSPKEHASDFLIKYHTEMFYKRNVAFSQPYYSRHPEVHLKRGEVNSFLKAYYNCFPAIIDRETGTFWEHFFYASPHKPHEEGWFLMETRWMLCMENDKTLMLLPGIPRRWMQDGNAIRIKNLATYFGKLSLEVISNLRDNKISVVITVDNEKKLEDIIIRIPHPDGLIAKDIIGGKYIAEKESVLIENPGKKIEVTVVF